MLIIIQLLLVYILHWEQAIYVCFQIQQLINRAQPVLYEGDFKVDCSCNARPTHSLRQQLTTCRCTSAELMTDLTILVQRGHTGLAIHQSETQHMHSIADRQQGLSIAQLLYSPTVCSQTHQLGAHLITYMDWWSVLPTQHASHYHIFARPIKLCIILMRR